MNGWAYWDRIVYEEPYNEPSNPYRMDRHDGICHLCRTGHKPGAAPHRAISYCGVCKHWFCREHRNDVFGRGWEAVKEMVGGRKLGCCGPREKA